MATVGTTATTSVDPVPLVADACEQAGAWLHVDAAYAGAAMVCPELRWAFDGVERADSLVVNAHKWMLTPMDCSLFWSRRPEALRNAFSLIPDYLRTPDAEDALSLSEYGPALGRRFRSLKLWAVLRCVGRSGLQAHIRRGIALAERFEAWVGDEEGWELCAPRPFSVVCFRLEGTDKRNRELLERVNARRDLHLPRRAAGALRPAAGRRTDANQRGGHQPRMGRLAKGSIRTVIRRVLPVGLLLAGSMTAIALASASIPIPPGGTPPAQTFVGQPAVAHPIKGVAPTPQNPFMAPNGTSEIHGDAWQSDTSRWAGPMGRNPSTVSNYIQHDCGSITFDSQGRVVSVCVGLGGPELYMFNPKTLATMATFMLPPRQSVPTNPFQDFTGGGYFDLNNHNQVVVSTTTKHIFVLAETSAPRVQGGPRLRPQQDHLRARTSRRRCPTPTGRSGS